MEPPEQGGNKPASGQRESYKSPANILTIVSICLSAVAFVASMKSCQVSREAHELAQKQYREERLLILQGEFNDKGDQAKLKSSDGSLNFLEGVVHFPKKISKEEWRIRSSDKTLFLASAKYGLQEVMKEKVPRDKGYAQVNLDGKIPILIDAYYTSKGDSYLDRSLYLLSVEFVQTDNEQEPPSIKFTGLLFVQRFPQNAWVTTDYLDQLIANDSGFYLPPKEPK